MMQTKFTLARLDVIMPDKKTVQFWFDGNGKITLNNGSFENPVANAFSLVQVEDCPFATPTCASICYVHNLEKAEKDVHRAYRHNSKVMREVLEHPPCQETAVGAFADWINEHCPRGLRWHVSGDIFSLRYAQFIASVCSKTPKVPFWIYTRSFAYIEPLLAARNLVVNLSADKDNWEQALLAHRRHGVRVCYLSIEGEVPRGLPDGSVIFPNYTLRGRDLTDPKQAPWWQSLTKRQKTMVCPPDFFGQSEKFRCGPCRKCLTH